ncbi:hypothetical protein B0H13DRAFT_2265856 [Mycena leptocephala]|nr:hypothetical protein B0H13DRAFT_2265856 [Mycena leptocephala]
MIYSMRDRREDRAELGRMALADSAFGTTGLGGAGFGGRDEDKRKINKLRLLKLIEEAMKNLLVDYAQAASKRAKENLPYAPANVPHRFGYCGVFDGSRYENSRLKFACLTVRDIWSKSIQFGRRWEGRTLKLRTMEPEYALYASTTRLRFEKLDKSGQLANLPGEYWDLESVIGIGSTAIRQDLSVAQWISPWKGERSLRIPQKLPTCSAALGGNLITALGSPTPTTVLTDSTRTTPVFVRFSIVQGSRGSADTMYTPEGNWDLVGNNIPVFCIQDAIKFPDFVHAVKPELGSSAELAGLVVVGVVRYLPGGVLGGYYPHEVVSGYSLSRTSSSSCDNNSSSGFHHKNSTPSSLGTRVRDQVGEGSYGYLRYGFHVMRGIDWEKFSFPLLQTLRDTFMTTPLSIPLDIYFELIPPDDLSVWEFAEFPIPRVTLTGKSRKIRAVDFFVQRSPTITSPREVQSILASPDELVDQLYDHATTLLASPFASQEFAVECLHIPSSMGPIVLAIWSITYWRTTKLLRPAKLKWAAAKERLLQLTKPKKRQDVEATRIGFDNKTSIVDLALYTGRDWFTDTQQSHMLDLLRSDILANDGALEDEIPEIWAVESIKLALKYRHEYNNPERHQRARTLGNTLASGLKKRIGMMGNISNKHWISTVVDARQARILYGDSYKNFTWGRLPISRQHDGFNCGLLAHNSLGHHFLPKKYPLIETATNAPVADARLRVMLRVVNRHLDICNEMAIDDALSSPAPESLEVSGHGFEFTFRVPSATPSMACSDKSDSEVAEGSDKMSFASEAPSTPYTEEDFGCDSDLESPPANTRDGLGKAKGGLIKFFGTLATEDDKMEIARWREGREGTFTQGQGSKQPTDQQNAARQEHKKDGVRIRQQKHRKQVKTQEIRTGERSPGGTKRKERIRDKKRQKENRGRMRKTVLKDAVYTNWMTPLLWPQIEEAARHPSLWPGMSASAIQAVLIKNNPTIFAKISRTTINSWIDRRGEKPCWSENTLARAEKGNFQGHPNGGRRGALAQYPEIVESITEQLRTLRNAGAPVTLISARALFVGTLLERAPEIFEKRYKDGSHFKNTTSNKCSDQISAESDGLIGSYGIADRDPKRGDINFLSMGPLASFAIAISPPLLPRSATLGARSDPPMLAFHLKSCRTATD